MSIKAIIFKHRSCSWAPTCAQLVSMGDRLSKPTGIILVTTYIALTWKLLQWSCTRALNRLSHRC